MSGTLQVLQPPEGVWVELVPALTWIRYQHSVDLATLLSVTCGAMDKSEEEIRVELETAWRELADLASSDCIKVRGRQIHEGQTRLRGRNEVKLECDDFRCCRHLAWPLDDTSEATARVERVDNSFSGSFFRRAHQLEEDYDFIGVVVCRNQLMSFWPVPKPSVVKRFASRAKEAQAVSRLIQEFQRLDPATNRKAAVLNPIKEELGLGDRQARRAWVVATLDFPEWRLPGAPRK